jgi:hypothetical protein
MSMQDVKIVINGEEGKVVPGSFKLTINMPIIKPGDVIVITEQQAQEMGLELAKGFEAHVEDLVRKRGLKAKVTRDVASGETRIEFS